MSTNTQESIVPFRSEDERAGRTGKTVVRHFEHHGVRYAWAFLKNGLQVLAPLKRLPVVDVRIAVRNGARDDEIYGEAHAIEHLVCGDQNRVSELFRSIADLGFWRNAAAYPERTEYLARTQCRGSSALIDGMIKLVFGGATSINENRWKEERPAILQETRQKPPWEQSEIMVRAGRYPNDPHKQVGACGSEENVLRLTIDHLRRRYEDAYVPQNGAILIEGLNDIENALYLIESHPLLQKTRDPSSRRSIIREPDAERYQDFVIHAPGGPNIERLIMTSNAVITQPKGKKDLGATILLLREILRCGPLRDTFRFKHGMVYSTDLSQYRQDPDRQFVRFVAQMPAARMEEASALWKDLWENACLGVQDKNDPIQKFIRDARSDHGLNRAKRQMSGHSPRMSDVRFAWLVQNTISLRPDSDDLATDDLFAHLRHAPLLADLRWQAIRVLRAP